MRNRNRGFTLIEIMIVVAVVLIILAIAVPSFLRSRVVANESAALANCRTISNATQLYTINRDTYPSRLPDLIEPASSPPYIDPELASGKKQGYQYTYNLVNADHFTLTANPTTVVKGRYFYMDETGVVHANANRQANINDPIVF
ncbi:MAG TPA: prepilin-type N-terminal cleavage/methylation domain-containing protein [Patescibacteria group bacterium]|nr:prepilin-type N-terminal cleavage/methylation domain-containing protein [Patescibacteria group bacterium]